MLDFGWAELLVVGLIILLVVGPKDIPKIMYQAGRMFRRLHYMKFALSRQFDDFMEKAELQASQAADDKAEEGKEPAAVSNEKTAKPDAEKDDDDVDLLMDESNPYFIKADEESDLDSEEVTKVLAVDVPADKDTLDKDDVASRPSKKEGEA